MILIELARSAGIDPRWAAGTAGGEYKSACPFCGGKDRFSIQPHKQQKHCTGYYFCRQCDKRGDSIQFCRDFLGDSFQEASDRVGATIPIEQRHPLFKLLKKQSTYKPAEVFPPPVKWIQKAGAFVSWSHKQLLQKPNIIEYLEQRGIPLEAITSYKIGLCPMSFYRSKLDWGIHEDDKQIWLPAGIVIPTSGPNGEVIRIKIRRNGYRDEDECPKYVAVSGSANGLNIIGDMTRETMIVVESELDAFAMHYAMRDFAFLVAVGSNIKNPDNITDHLATHKNKLLICYDNDNAGQKMLLKWTDLYRHARGCPMPNAKDVGEYIEKGGNIRALIKKQFNHEKP